MTHVVVQIVCAIAMIGGFACVIVGLLRGYTRAISQRAAFRLVIGGLGIVAIALAVAWLVTR